MKDHHTFSFGPFVLDNTERELLYGEIHIRLTEQQCDLLLLLVQNPQRLVTKEEINAKVWEGRYVEEGNIPRAINELRNKLAPHRELIRNVPRKGYRLETEVVEHRPQIPADECPWFGLRTLDAPQAEFFSGRETEVGEMLDLLADNNFLAVVGSSGAGKSSLVRAGLIPALQSGQLYGKQDWVILLFRPGSTPLKNLAEQLLKAIGATASIGAIEALAEQLRTAPQTLSETLREAYGGKRDWQALIAVDQFEELMARDGDAEMCQQFIECLLHAVSTLEQHVYVVLTVRTDFYPKLENYERLWKRITRRQYGVRHLGRAELRQVIQQPAARVGLEVEEALVEEILDDLGEGAGALPLLSHALAELFKRREDRRLTFEAYRSLGKIKETVANHANAVFEQFNPDEQDLAKRILIKLVNVGEEPDRDVRRQVPISDLTDDPEHLPAVESIVGKLAHERLLSTCAADSEISPASSAQPQIVVEMAHEALIRHWHQLSDWLKEKRRARRLFVSLNMSARDWQDSDCDREFLYRGNRLANTLEARAEYEEFLGPLHRDFLEASNKLEEEEHRRAEREMRSKETRRRLKQQRKTMFIIALVLTSLTFFAVWKWRDAGQQRDLARANSWAGASISQLSLNPELSLLLAMEAGQLALTPETTRAMRQSLSASYVQATLTEHRMQVISIAASPDGKYLLTGGADGAKLWDLPQKKVVRTFGNHAERMNWAAPSPDWHQIVTASQDRTARVWDASSGTLIAELRGHTNHVNHAVFSPDGTKILTGSDDNTARIWEARTGQELKVLAGHESWINTTVYSPDGKLCVTASGDKTARVWDTQTGVVLVTLAGHKGTVICAAFSRDGKQLITGGSDKTVRIWNVATWQEENQIRGHLSNINSVEYSHGGQWILTASKDGTARLWNAGNGLPLMDFRGHFSGVNTAVFSPDDAHIYTASGDQTARLWEVRFLPSAIHLAGHRNSVARASFSSNGEQLVTASLDNTAVLWHAKTGKTMHVLRHPSAVRDAAFHPHAKQIATAGDDGKVRLWNAETGTLLREFSGHIAGVQSVAFNRAGTHIITASQDQTARIWDVASGQSQLQLSGHKDSVDYALFSLDGNRVATASKDNTVRVWDAASGKTEIEWNVGTGKIKSVVFSADGKYLAAACGDYTVRIWNLDSQEIIAVLRGHEEDVNYAEFSPNGELVVTAGADQTTHLWDFGTGKSLFQLPNPQGAPVTHASFSPDGKFIVTTDEAGSVIIYSCELCGASPTELLSLARQRKTRDLTAAERVRYLASGNQKF